MTDGTDVRVGVDVGGTFTDVVTVEDGSLAVTKTPSTPDAPDAGVFDGLAAVQSEGIDPAAIGSFAHGTTVATNAVLEREWAETALVTTEGFRDALEIGRQARPDIYDFQATKPRPVVPRDRRYEVPERLDERGRVERELDEAAVREVAGELADRGTESVAVALLFAFENDDHERRVAQLLAAELDADTTISLSSDVLPEIREYERTLATALNAALKPVLDSYLGRLETGLDERGVAAPLAIMQSNGGLVGADHARTRPISTLLSGPAAGVQGAAYVAGLRDVEDVITMDMGGTSCDVSLVRGGEPAVSTDHEIGDYPVGVPMVDVHTIGAGGGSIAWLDDGGALRVGPKSAGADPGPVAYGRGGDRPTVTDAHLLLGRLDPDALLAEELDADPSRVATVVEEQVADPLGTGVREAAQGILDVANANMERALRVVSVERGHDPREFGLVAFGGAGPLHAAALADALDVPRVLVPRTAGVLSALGLLATDRLHDFSTSMVRPLADVDPTDLQAVVEAFEREGRERLAAAGQAPDRIAIERSLDLRYVGQSYELSVPLRGDGDGSTGASGTSDPGSKSDSGGSGPGSTGGSAGSSPESTADDLTEATIEAAARRFHERHERRYGHADPDEPVELVTVRVRARGAVDPPTLAPATTEGESDDAIRSERTVGFDGDDVETRIYDRAGLPAGAAFDGPAVVEGTESTVVVRPGQSVTVDEYGTIVLEVDA